MNSRPGVTAAEDMAQFSRTPRELNIHTGNPATGGTDLPQRKKVSGAAMKKVRYRGLYSQICCL
jgi:hypothetical protein